MVRPVGTLSLAVDLWDAADEVSDGLATEMRALATQIDSVFLRLPHDPGGQGFVTGVDVYTLKPFGPEESIVSTGWFAEGERRTHAEVANLCAMRFRQTKDRRYRGLIVETAKRYLTLEPALSDPGYP